MVVHQEYSKERRIFTNEFTEVCRDGENASSGHSSRANAKVSKLGDKLANHISKTAEILMDSKAGKFELSIFCSFLLFEEDLSTEHANRGARYGSLQKIGWSQRSCVLQLDFPESFETFKFD